MPPHSVIKRIQAFQQVEELTAALTTLAAQRDQVGPGSDADRYLTARLDCIQMELEAVQADVWHARDMLGWWLSPEPAS